MVPVAVDLNESSSVLVGACLPAAVNVSADGGSSKRMAVPLSRVLKKRHVNERSRGFSFEARSSDPVLWSRGSSGSGSALEASKAADLWVGFGHTSPGEAYGEV
ncbi:hypothetical protein F2Q70_00015812 [Brassica cretica]|uniref:Uncharacterized protein n=1 Tax=Brassica cretica TaxID=69181 RepID=A0A8S9I6Q5_BRACR|nr:hypothetical protein F2Q70_00015812 [Brassica cretica]KAF2598088.1 hypothetical protein F2Q68_00008744 [Brassica cretica]